MDSQENKTTPPGDNRIDVAVVTTSGRWPGSGFEGTPVHQPIRIQLAAAARHLGIVDTSNWVARVNARELNIDQNYAENGLAGQVEIDFGRREAGGGRS